MIVRMISFRCEADPHKTLTQFHMNMYVFLANT